MILALGKTEPSHYGYIFSVLAHSALGYKTRKFKFETHRLMLWECALKLGSILSVEIEVGVAADIIYKKQWVVWKRNTCFRLCVHHILSC